MKKAASIQLYNKYYRDNDNENIGQFVILAEKFNVKNALYPGSFVHIAPSLVFPKVTYIDTDKRTKTFFSDSQVSDYINNHKRYVEDSSFILLPEDYRKEDLNLSERFDVLISQYAGFISKYCTRFLKVNGLLLVNNSHGDAGMASIDKRYKLIGVLNRKSQIYSYSDKNLDSYFIPKKEVPITEEYLESIGKGIGYTKSPTSYLFRKMSDSK
ncbi:hypothetical protein ACFLU1_04535 [Chloroflexota bacterium]